MQTVLIVIHLMVVITLVIVVLLQRSEGGALGIGSSGTGGLFTGRGQANALTRATAVLAGLFFATSIALTILASFNRAPKSIFEGQTPTPGQTTPASGGSGSVLDDLKRLQNSVPNDAPAQPTTTTPPTTPNSQ